jgi:hypothetical protein
MTFRKSLLLLISLTMIAALVACSSSSHTTPPPPPTTGPLADGNYVFSLAGFDAPEGSPYYASGAFTVSGGAITAGEQDLVDDVLEVEDAINPTGSSITATADGNLTIVLATQDTNIGADGTGVETLNGTILPNSTTGRTLITEFDDFGSGSGEIDPQDTTVASATPTAGYAFVLNGLDGLASPSGGDNPISMGGIINVDGPGTISGTGSVFDANDDYSGSAFAGEALSGAVSAPDTFGRVTFTLDATDSTDFPEIMLVGYIVDATHIRLVETVDTYEGTMGGTALSQGANTGTFGTTSAVGGNTYVIGLTGTDTNNAFLQVVSQLTPSGTTSAVSGFVDFNDLVISSATTATSPDPVTSPSYAVDGAGAGDVTITGLTDGTNTFNVQLYLDGNGNALAISMDLNDAVGGFGFQQPAAAVGAFAASNFNGAYGLDVTGWDFNLDGEFDAVGPVTADGTSAITGAVDLNWLNFVTGPATFPAAPVTGTFTANTSGIFSDGLTGLDLTDCALFSGGAGCSADVFNYYLTGDAAGDTFAIETDLNQITLGYFTQQ